MLTPEQIVGKAHEAGLYQDGINTQLPLWVLTQQELEWFARAIETEVRKQDDALIQQMVEALERAKKHHFTTSLPLVIENYGSRVKCANEGSIVWRDLIPSAITAGRARLAPSTEPASNSTRTTK